MKLPTINCATHVRDGGIDATAALNSALQDALVGLSPSEQSELKITFGRAMAEIGERIINPAIQAFPELEPSDEIWTAVANARAKTRAGDE